MVSGSGEEVNVKAILSNLDTTSMSARTSTIGEYKVDFTTGMYSTIYERVNEAFQDVGGFIERETEAPTEVTTVYVPPINQTDPPVEENGTGD